MGIIPPEVVQPSQKEVVGSITTTDKEEHNFVKDAAASVSKLVPSFTHHQAKPITPETPVPESSALNAVGAERVGATPAIDIKDIKDRLGRTVAHGASSAGQVIGIEEHSFPVGIASNSDVFTLARKKKVIKDRLRGLLHLKKAA